LETRDGTFSIIVIAVAIEPPEIPLRKRNALVEVPGFRYSSPVDDGPMDLSVLLARYADMSEGTESKPQDGTIIEPVFVAK
jgi:hypothetical protein